MRQMNIDTSKYANCKESKVKLKLFLCLTKYHAIKTCTHCLIKHHVMKAYGGVEVYLAARILNIGTKSRIFWKRGLFLLEYTS